MKPLQKTIQKPVEFKGVGVNVGREVALRLLPGTPGSGVVFVRTDLPGSPRIAADPELVVPRLRRTVLRQGEAEVQMTEHVLAAVSGLDLDNLTIELKGPELPACDGSARTFAKLLHEAGIVEQEAPRVCRTVREPVTVTEAGSTLTALPGAGGLSISYTLEYAHMSLPSQHFEIRVSPATFLSELAPARTFVFQREAPALLASGLGRGASLENTLVLRDDGTPVYGQLRFPDEFARHKVVDLLGDLRLLGSGLSLRVVADRTGHAQNFQLIARLRESLVELPPDS